MVEIQPAISDSESKSANGNSTTTSTTDSTMAAGNDNQPAINGDSNNEVVAVDFRMIKQARELLKGEFGIHGDKFSLEHYKAIIGKENPLICWRYIVHCRFKLRDSVELMKQVLIWRKENNYDEQSKYCVKELWHLAPFCFTGQTKDGHDVLYVIGKNYRKQGQNAKLIVKDFIARLLIDWDKKHENDMSQWVMVFDVSESGFRNIDLDLMAWLVSIRDYAPARTNRILVTGIPFIVRPLVRLIISWLPENFRKIVYCGTHEQLVTPQIHIDSLPAEIGNKDRDLSYKLAPTEAVWMDEMPTFDQTIKNALEESIGFNASADRREKIRALQLERELKLKQKELQQ